MPKFAVLLHGKNLVFISGGKHQSGGVYSCRSVEAENREAAIPRAVQKLLRDEVFMEEVWNPPSAPPDIEVEQVDELDDGVNVDEADTACVFYSEDEEGAEDDARRSPRR